MSHSVQVIAKNTTCGGLYFAQVPTKINGHMSFKFTQQMKQKPNWAKLICADRKKRKMTQPEYGAMFDVTYAAVSDWERGVTDPPGEVTWYLYQQELKRWKK